MGCSTRGNIENTAMDANQSRLLDSGWTQEGPRKLHERERRESLTSCLLFNFVFSALVFLTVSYTAAGVSPCFAFLLPGLILLW